MTYRTVLREKRHERELPALRLLSVVTAVWFLAAGWADVLMGYPLLAVLDFFIALLFLFFRIRMNTMPPSAVRGFVPPILLFLNLLPLGASFLEAGFFTLLLRHIVTLLGTVIYMQFQRRDVFFTYLMINAFSLISAFILSGDFRGEMVNLVICYVFIVSSMYFFSRLQRKTSRELAALSSAERQARDMAGRDPLTGLYNRRRFDEELAGLLPEGTGVTLILIDLDDFKDINDTQGHQAGDEALKKMASAIAGAVRRDDIACRIGGDEFAVLLPDCPENNGLVIAENICRKVRSCAPFLSISLGVASAPAGSSPDEAFKKADAALYEAKSKGKGCIVSWGRLIPEPAAQGGND
jgi:diguanylate cyclase (GGDEF)-like protein